MTQLAMTNDGDLDISNNKFYLVNGKEEIRQRIIQNLKTFLGEWFLNTLEGVPYYQIIFEKNVPPDLVADSLKDVILGTIGVVELTRFEPLDLDPVTRALTVDFEVGTADGPIVINEEIP